MVHPDAAGVPQHGPEHVPVGGIAGFGEPARVPGRLGPVLALLVEHVRRRADADAPGQDAGEGPGVGAAGFYPDGEVMDDADPHARLAGRALGRLELLVAEPLQPAVEFDPGRQLGPLLGAVGRRRGCRRVRPIPGPTAAALRRAQHQRAKSSSPCPCSAQKSANWRARAGPAADREHAFQGGQLRRVAGVAVQQVRRSGWPRAGCFGQAVPTSARPRGVQVAVFGDLLHPQVERVEEPPRGGQVRGVLDRRHAVRRHAAD